MKNVKAANVDPSTNTMGHFAVATCRCGVDASIPATHKDEFLRGAMARRRASLRNLALVKLGFEKLGWRAIKSGLECPACAEKRALLKKGVETEMTTAKLDNLADLGKAVVPMADISKPREASPEMEMDILEHLFMTYDRKAKRYIGTDTDTTVASSIGRGCLPGWVAKVRAERFGPAGNDEAEALRRKIEELGTHTQEQLGQLEMNFNLALTRFKDAATAELAALTRRLEALYSSEDKRVGK